MNYKITNKWVVVFGALSAQIAIGALYAWSLFNDPLSKAYGWDFDNVVFTYSISLLAFSTTTLLSGRLQITKGPRFTALLGGILYSGGIILSSFATTPIMLYITYGVITGAGVGFVYVCPLSTLVKWFPNKKGTVTGLATAAFAIGGFVFKTVIHKLLEASSYTPAAMSKTFLTLGFIYAIMTIGGALLLDVPKESEETNKNNSNEGKNYKRSDMIRTSNFYKLFISDLLALMPGLLVIGLAKDIGIQFVGLDINTAASVVGFIALINAAGRLASGAIADKLGALNVYRAMYLVTIISLGVLSFVDLTYPIFLVAILGIAIGYGSFLSLVPTIVGKLFGGKYFSANYSFIFQAYGIAALIGPVIKRNSTGFNQTFMIAMSTAIAGLVVAMFIRPNEKVKAKDIKPIPEVVKEV